MAQPYQSLTVVLGAAIVTGSLVLSTILSSGVGYQGGWQS